VVAGALHGYGCTAVLIGLAAMPPLDEQLPMYIPFPTEYRSRKKY
jgi:hypothetical protein